MDWENRKEEGKRTLLAARTSKKLPGGREQSDLKDLIVVDRENSFLSTYFGNIWNLRTCGVFGRLKSPIFHKGKRMWESRIL
jgi:hypothetical protein